MVDKSLVLVPVRTYCLAKDGIYITFSMEHGEEMRFVLEDAQGECAFSGQAIHCDETLLGLIVTVVLEVVPDSHTITFSLAVPSGNRPDYMRSIEINTFAVRTMSRTSFAGPEAVVGQIQEYEMMSLRGNAW